MTADSTTPCPECGTPIGRSVEGDRLVHAHPRYRRRLELGAAMVTGSMVVYVVWRAAPYLALGPAGALVDMPIAEDVGHLPPPDVPAHTLRGGLLLVALLGWWLLTTPRTPPAIRRRSWTRPVLRWLTVLVALATLVDRVIVLAGGNAWTGWFTLAQLLWVAHVPLAMLYVRHLGARAESRATRTLSLLAIVAMAPWFVPCLLTIIFATTLAPVVVQAGATIATASLWLALRRVNRRAASPAG